MMIPMMPFLTSEMVTATLATSADGAYDSAGKWIPGVKSNAPIMVTYTQPVKMNEMQMLEDGERISDYVKVWTGSAVDTREGAANADEIITQGHTYKVTQAEDRPIGVFRKVIMRRLDV